MSQGIVFYQSVARGISNPEGKEAVTYLGRVFRIPRSQHGSLHQLEWELSPRELVEQTRLRDGTRIERIADGVIERFEVFDQDSGDVWVMYRVPCRPAQPA